MEEFLINVLCLAVGHTTEFSSVKEARIVAGGDKVISWEVGIGEEMARVIFTHCVI